MGNHPQSSLSPERIEAIIVAAGRGTRLGGKTTKSMKLLGGKPLFAHAVETFQKISDISGIIVVVGLEEVEVARHWIQKLNIPKSLQWFPAAKNAATLYRRD